MLKRIALLLLLSATLPLAAAAQSCIEHISTTEHALQTVRERAEGVSAEKRPRIQGFIDDAARILDTARADCERAQTPLNRSFAIAQVLVAQGNISAAHLLIRAE